MHGRSVEEAIEGSPRLRKRKGTIIKAIGGALEQGMPSSSENVYP